MDSTRAFGCGQRRLRNIRTILCWVLAVLPSKTFMVSPKVGFLDLFKLSG